jgi:hypothetical protein
VKGFKITVRLEIAYFRPWIRVLTRRVHLFDLAANWPFHSRLILYTRRAESVSTVDALRSRGGRQAGGRLVWVGPGEAEGSVRAVKADAIGRIEVVRGANYVPSNAVNPTQMWTEFDPATIDRELGFAEELGLNSVRVFIQYLVHEHDAAGLLARFETLLGLASRHGLSVMPVLFDDCWLPEPFLGDQAPEPRPGLHNPYWQRSPGERRKALAFRPALRRYVEDLFGRFGRDQRILAWDLYNEPSATEASVALVRDVFSWARRLAPAQPLTACWYGALFSDITSIHFYGSPSRQPEEARRLIEAADSFSRPVLATEALGRPNHGEPQEILPLFSKRRIGWYLWELMIGADQTRYQWPNAPPAPDDIVFQGLLYPDGTPYRGEESQLIRAQAHQPADTFTRRPARLGYSRSGCSCRRPEYSVPASAAVSPRSSCGAHDPALRAR